MKKITFLRNLIVLVALLIGSGSAMGQTSVQNFGTGTGSHTSTTGSNSYLPNPTSGTTWARAGATAPNAPIVMATTSNPLGTNGTYVRAVASTSTSVAKFSPIVGYTGSTEFYTSFKVLFGDASAGTTATSGSWTFYQGTGAMYSDANDFAGAQVFASVRFTYAASGVVNLNYRGGGSWVTTGLTSTSFNQGTVYTIEIIGNNKASGTINYTYNGDAKTVAIDKFDLYINGVLVGDDLSKAALPNNTNVVSTTFIGISSTSNAANIFVDDVVVYNAVPATIGGAPKVDTPTFDPVAGTYAETQNVSISTETVGATIRYTTNGNDPDETSTVFSTPIAVSATTTIKAKAFKIDMDPSDVVTAVYTIVHSPTITVSEEAVPAMSALVGNTDTETITVNGLNLTGNITLAVTGTNASLFTLSTNSIAPTEGSVTDESVTITYTPTAAGSHSATLTLSSAGAEDEVRSLSGSATWPPLAAPVATEASGINQTGFTANWEAVVGATEYELNVYTKQISESANLLVNSDFETGETSPWVFESAMNQQIVSDIVKSGTYALRTSVTATKNLNQTINVENLKEYKLSFWYYITDASTGNGFRVWTTSGATINLPSSTTYFNTKGSWQYVETTFTTSASVLVLNFRTYSGCTFYLDDIKLTFETATSNPISGSPFTVTDGTSKAITGLSPSTTYYYTVKAANENVESAASNEMSVVTSFGVGTDNPSSLTSIYAHNAKIHFAATAGERVEVYNAVGQKIISTLATDGQNELSVNAKGVMIVKIGSRLAKVIL